MSESHTRPAGQAGGLASVTSRLGNCAEVLGAALTVWAGRDDSKAQPEIREAANTAMAAIGTMLDELYSARAVLAGQIHVSDRAADARVDALLAVPLADRLAAREAEIRARLDAPRPDQRATALAQRMIRSGGDR